MSVQNFDRSIYDKHSSFYVLSRLDSSADSFTVKMLTTDGEINFDKKYNISRLPNEMLLFSSIIEYQMRDCLSLIVSDGINEEIINLQTYEKIRRFINNPDSGFFVFMDSVPTTEIPGTIPKEDRCDYGVYGPVRFLKSDEPKVAIVNIPEVSIFEKILSVDGVGHIAYIKASLDSNFFTNQDPFPRSAATLQENLKQLIEWASVSQAPWSNTEGIALQASQFIDKLNIDDSFISHINDTQPNMQVYKYLLGDTSAVSKPDSPGQMTKLMHKEIMKRLSHVCLTNILSMYEIQLENELHDYISETEIGKLNGFIKLQGETFGIVDEIQNINDSNIDDIRSLIKSNLGDLSYNLAFGKLELICNLRHVLGQSFLPPDKEPVGK